MFSFMSVIIVIELKRLIVANSQMVLEFILSIALV